MYSNKNIKMVHNVKFLGININEKLSWNYHVSQLCNTIARNVGVLSTLQFLPENVLKMLYHTLISSHLNYCLSIWGLTSKCNIARIHVLQKKSMRIISHSPYTSHSAHLFDK